MRASTQSSAGSPGLGADVAATLAGWLVYLAIDPTSAAVVGLPLVVAAVA